MKEKIYTIPINDAFHTGCGCPLCHIEDRLEDEAVEYTLGAAMMEPDFREKTNEAGFCHTHYTALQKQQKALPLALVLQSYAKTQRDALEDHMKVKASGGGLFQKNNYADKIRAIGMEMKQHTERCAVCERVEHFMEQYLKNVIYLWKAEPDFRETFQKAPFFCYPHFAQLLIYAADGLREKELALFTEQLWEKEKASFAELSDDIDAFVKLFDHRSSKETPSPQVQSAIKRTIQRYSGHAKE